MPIAYPSDGPNSSPLYEEIRQRVTRGLIAGEWKPGELIPSEIELARRFGVAKGTVRRALDDLVSEKILVRRQGRGTFVATHTSERARYHFLHMIGRDGSRAPPLAKLLCYRVVKGTDEACAKLEIARQSKLINVQDLVAVGAQGVFVDDILIPQSLFPGLTEQVFRDREGTIYALYQDRFNINVVRIREELSAGHAPAEHAKRLAMRQSAPALIIDRIAYTYENKPVELRRSWVNTESHVYLSDLQKS